jgi:hypothetical protein
MDAGYSGTISHTSSVKWLFYSETFYIEYTRALTFENVHICFSFLALTFENVHYDAWYAFWFLWWRLFIYLYHFFLFIYCSAGARYPDGAGYFGKDHQVCAWRKQRLMQGTLF